MSDVIILTARQQSLTGTPTHVDRVAAIKTNSVDATSPTGTLTIGGNSSSVIVQNLSINSLSSLSNATMPGSIKLTSAGGGTFTLTPASTASNFALTVPGSGTLGMPAATSNVSSTISWVASANNTYQSSGFGQSFICGPSGQALVSGYIDLISSNLSNNVNALFYYNSSAVPAQTTSVGTDTAVTGNAATTNNNTGGETAVSLCGSITSGLTPGTTYYVYIALLNSLNPQTFTAGPDAQISIFTW